MEVVPIRNPEHLASLRENLLTELKKVKIPKLPTPRYTTLSGAKLSIRSNIIGDIGKTMTLGYGNTRRGIKDYKANSKYPELMKALVDYGNAIVPIGFEYNGITLNHGVKAKKHVDSLNVGTSYITGIGEYTGGELRIHTSDTESVEMDLKHRAVGFNGALYAHETMDFAGDRYTIIYYKQKWPGKPTGYDCVGK